MKKNARSSTGLPFQYLVIYRKMEERIYYMALVMKYFNVFAYAVLVFPME